MKISNLKKLKPKKLIVFDLDGTLTPSKSPLRRDMAALLSRLLKEKPVAVIGGGTYKQFKTQFVAHAKLPPALMKNLFLFPTSSTTFYKYHTGWKKVYAHGLTREQKKKIFAALHLTFREGGYVKPKKTYSKIIEDRGSQITFSAVGQKAPVKIKEAWKRKYDDLRLHMTKILQKHLPDFEVRAGGLTSIDVTKKGIDKAYGLEQIKKHLHVDIKDMLFVGDAIFPGGNDYAVVRTGVDYIPVTGPEQTKEIIRTLLKSDQ
ncbi:MAG: HAD-IIB family hydrolase [Candidatus Sungbacteria bacterium]|nr:HAD-IIB family hydrolase [Candidatus Sungbacteria bacterium]